ncbi:MAG: pentapeptide repeat-containing protein, partial [Candidatus Dormibacteraceae bacterium]
NWRWTGFEKNGTLWDWIQLLSAPIFVTALPFIFRGPAAHSSTSPANAALVAGGTGGGQVDAYREHILELLLNHGLAESTPGAPVREVARARTLTVLREAGPVGKREVVELLCETALMGRDRQVVDVRGADLTGADLHALELAEADLRGADLRRANLRGTDLRGADLRGAALADADLTGADVHGAAR